MADFKGVSLQVTVYVSPGNVETFLGFLRPIYDTVTKGSECAFFVVHKANGEPGMIRWVEGWNKDRNWLLNVQLKKALYKPHLAATQPLFVKPREFQIVEKLPSGWAKAKPGDFAFA